ncbi:hypothetical protein N7488_010675 [Penicillium malachiteum]|nr:hypothetical protein N7488_010675 [Penicillium malachiteum]
MGNVRMQLLSGDISVHGLVAAMAEEACIGSVLSPVLRVPTGYNFRNVGAESWGLISRGTELGCSSTGGWIWQSCGQRNGRFLNTIPMRLHDIEQG